MSNPCLNEKSYSDKIRIPACHANMVRAGHKSANMSILSSTILNLSKGIAGRSNDKMTETNTL